LCEESFRNEHSVEWVKYKWSEYPVEGIHFSQKFVRRENEEFIVQNVLHRVVVDACGACLFIVALFIHQPAFILHLKLVQHSRMVKRANKNSQLSKEELEDLEEEETETPTGSFAKASDDIIKRRKIVKLSE